MTTTDLSSLVHKQATLNLDGLTFAVAIIEARTAYGRVDVKITPMMGEGSRWVRLDSVEVAS